MTWFARALHVDRRCPPGWRLTRAISGGDVVDRALEQHLDGCEECASVSRSLCKLSATVQAFPRPADLGREPRRVISARLLTAAPPPPDRRPRWRAGLFLALGAGAGVLAVLAIWGRPSREAPDVVAADVSAPASRSRASIQAIGAARFSRVQAPPDEVVQLDEGLLVLDVAPLPPGERFRVRMRHAEVEVRGTRFQISASDGELMAVSVTHGRVEVVSREAGRAVLEPGDEWVYGGFDHSPTVQASALDDLRRF